jgi:hypothetical protein
MQSKLFTRYSFDECTNEEKLFEKLDALLQDGKIEYNAEDQYTFKIKDIELTDSEIQEICDLFDELEVFPYMESDDDIDDFDDFDDFEDEEDDYTTRKYRSKDDDFEDY